MTVKESINRNLEILYKLDKAGVKNISTAIDYATISDDYEKQKHIRDASERKRIVAQRFKVSVSCVEKALSLMSKVI